MPSSAQGGGRDELSMEPESLVLHCYPGLDADEIMLDRRTAIFLLPYARGSASGLLRVPLER